MNSEWWEVEVRGPKRGGWRFFCRATRQESARMMDGLVNINRNSVRDITRLVHVRRDAEGRETREVVE